MRTRTISSLAAVVVLSLLAPAAVSAQTSTLLADNPGVDCDAPLPASMVTGDLGSTVVVVEEAQLDKVTVAADAGGEVVDAAFTDEDTGPRSSPPPMRAPTSPGPARPSTASPSR